MANPPMTDNDIAAVVSAAVAAERERCAKLVPTNWCDQLLTGKDAPKLPMNEPAIEALLLAIQDRIRNTQ